MSIIFKSNISLQSLNIDPNLLASFLAVIISTISLIKTSKFNRETLESTSRAYLSIYSEPLIANRSFFYIIIRNFGNSSAFIEKIEVDNKTEKMIQIKNKKFLKKLEGSQIAPNQSITHVVSTQNKEFDYNHISEFKINYVSVGKNYSDSFKFNLSTSLTMPNISISSENFKDQFLTLYQEEIRRKL